MPSRSFPWKSLAGLIVVAAVALVLVGTRLLDEQRPDGGTVSLPDGRVVTIRALEFARPDLRNSEGMHKQWQEAGAAYQTGDYSRSARLFGEIESSSGAEPSRHDAALYRGISLVMNGRNQEADDALQRARESADQAGLGSTVDSYYLGVAALGRNDLPAARAALRLALGGPFDQQARDLLAGL